MRNITAPLDVYKRQGQETDAFASKNIFEGSFIMTHEIKPENIIQCTGRVMFKNFNNENKSLFMVIGIFTPKLIWGRTEGEAESRADYFNHDFPAFVMSGEVAVSYTHLDVYKRQVFPLLQRLLLIRFVQHLKNMGNR